MIAIIILLIVFHVLLESAEIIERIWPWTADVYIHPFINYHWPYDERGINLLWWINYCSNDALWIVTFISLAYVAKFYSKRLYYVALVFLGYHCFGHLMLWYNYRSSHYLYWLQLVCDIASVSIALKVKDKQTIVRSIKKSSL